MARDEERNARTGGRTDWTDERSYWEQNYRSRPYVRSDTEFGAYEPGYRYGFESAQRHRGRDWHEVEPELERDWERYEHGGETRSKWQDIKASVRDAWDRVTGSGEEDRRR